MAKTLNLYAIYDKVAGSAIATVDSANDGVCVRSQAPLISKMIPVGDASIYQVGVFDLETMEVIPCSPRLISWDSYKVPENPFKKEVDNNEGKN